LALTLKTVQKSIESTLSTAANSGINVSRWAADYNAINQQVNTIEDRIGVSKARVDDIYSTKPELKTMIKELYQAGATDRDILTALGMN